MFNVSFNAQQWHCSTKCLSSLDLLIWAVTFENIDGFQDIFVYAKSKTICHYRWWKYICKTEVGGSVSNRTFQIRQHLIKCSELQESCHCNDLCLRILYFEKRIISLFCFVWLVYSKLQELQMDCIGVRVKSVRKIKYEDILCVE